MLSPTISKARPAAGTAGIIRTGQLGKGRFSKAFSCRILNCSDPVPHGKASCGVFKGLSVSDCWNIIQGVKSCKLCLRHAITATCNQEKAVGGKKVCGVQGCKEAHHPLLHCDSALSMKLKVTSRFRFPKAVEAIPQVVSAGVSGDSLAGLKVVAGLAKIAESPGIGNSRVPNRVPAKNSVTPEQARQLYSYSQSVAQLGLVDKIPVSLISKYVKFSDDNLFANRVSLTDEAGALEASRSAARKFSPATKYEVDSSLERGPSKPYSVAELYLRLEGSPEIKSQSLGTNYISDTSSPAATPFDPVESCKRFGGEDCEALYSGSQEKCVKGFNKSLFPETYSEVPGALSSSVAIDRPLGTFAQYVPSRALVPGSAFSDPPSFMSLLPSGASVGERGEPLLDIIQSDPVVYEYGGPELSEYGNTEFGIVEFIRAKLERNSEFNCAGFDSPFYYQVCVNLMKCKRFSPPYNNKYYLDFCPQTLSGGRLK